MITDVIITLLNVSMVFHFILNIMEVKYFLLPVKQIYLFKNAKKLNIDLTKLNAIVLSHGDYDHGNGLKYLDVKTDLICHPDFMLTRISRRTGNDNGLNQTREELQRKFNLVETKEPYNINDEITFLGQIERNNDFEKEKNLPATDENGKI